MSLRNLVSRWQAPKRLQNFSSTMLTFASAVLARELGERVASLAEQRYAITNAQDLLISGI